MRWKGGILECGHPQEKTLNGATSEKDFGCCGCGFGWGGFCSSSCGTYKVRAWGDVVHRLGGFIPFVVFASVGEGGNGRPIRSASLCLIAFRG